MPSARALHVGEHVVIKMTGSLYRGLAGTVVRVSRDKEGFTTYTVQLDSSKEQLDYQLLDLRLLK